jgi:L-fuculose-phosphate aldolase
MKNRSQIVSQIMKIGRKLYSAGFAPATDGNISVRSGDNIYITASGEPKGDLKAKDILKLSSSGKPLQNGTKPTSELAIHMAVYRARRDVGAVIHAHPPYATAASLSGIPLENYYMPEIVLTLGKIPKTPYFKPMSYESAVAVGRLIKNHNAVILSRHGSVTTGKNLREAFFNLERLESYARIMTLAFLCGSPKALPKNEVKTLKALALKLKIGPAFLYR